MSSLCFLLWFWLRTPYSQEDKDDARGYVWTWSERLENLWGVVTPFPNQVYKLILELNILSLLKGISEIHGICPLSITSLCGLTGKIFES